MAVFRFGSFELDPAARELRRDGVVQPLQPKVFELLAHLLRNRHRPVAREELLRALWPDVRVTPASVSRALKSARRALGDDGRRQASIRTLAGGHVRFVAEVAAAGAAPPAQGEGGGYVGRGDTLVRLRERLAAACAGRGGVVLLVGAPGIGKTRTATELLEWASGEGAATLVVHAHGGEAPFWPWHAVLARLLPGEPPVAAELPEHGSGDGRLRLFDALRRALGDAASRAPLVLLLDDLQQAGEASIALLDALVPDVAALPVLVVGTLRTEETSARAGLSAALGRLARRPHVERVEVPPLDLREVAALAERCAGAPLSRAEVARLADLTAGNPLWIEEALRGARARLGGGRFEGGGPLGPSLERTIAGRLAELPRPVRRWLEAAAVLGAAFDPSLAARLGGVAPRAARGALKAARAHGLLAPADPAAPSFARFAHPLFRQVLYQQLAAAEREALPARAAAALETLGEAAPVETIAEHLLAAGEAADAANAAGWGARAGALAERAGAFERAAGLYERALQRTGAAAEPKAACELAVALARSRRRLGDDSAAEPAARAMRWARERGWPRLYAEAALAFAGPMDGYRLPRRELAGALGDALAVLGPDNRDLRARILARQAAEESFASDRSRQAALGREAVAVARSTGDVLLEAQVVDTPFSGILSGLAAEEVRSLGERLLRFGEKTQREGTVLVARLMRLHDRLADADVGGFDAELACAEELARELRDPVAIYRIQLFSAMRALLAGDPARSEAIALEAFAMAGHGRFEGAAGFLGAQLVLARAEQGRLQESLPLLERDAELRPGPSSRCFLAWAYAEVEDAGACRRVLDELAARDLATLDRFPWRAANAAMLAPACWLAGLRGPGPVLEALLARAGRRVAVRGNITAHGPVAHAQALLAALRGDVSAARERFDEALRVARAMGTAPWIARIERDRQRSGAG